MSAGNDQGPMTEDAAFEQDWDAALRGELTPPTPGQESSPDTPAERQPDAPRPAQAATPTAPQEPPAAPDFSTLARQAGFDSVEDALKAARQFQSLRGNLPQIEQRWREEHLTPLERELQQLRSEKQQALEYSIQFTPDGQRRTADEERQIRAQLAEQEQAQRATLEQQQQAAQVAAAQQALQQEWQNVEQARGGVLRLVAVNALDSVVTQMAQAHELDVEELRQYVRDNDLVTRVKNMPRTQDFGPILDGIEAFAKTRHTQIANQRQRDAQGRYRSMGDSAGSGRGSAPAGSRWDNLTDAEFERAWERAKLGRLA